MNLAHLKVTFVTVMPSPYVQDLFASIAGDGRFDLRVFYLEQEAPDTYWGPQKMPPYAQVLPGSWMGFWGARVHFNPSVFQELYRRTDHLVVVVGYVGLTNQWLMRRLAREGKPWVFWGEVPGLNSRNRFGRWLRTQAQKPLRNAAGVAAVGSHAVTAYRTLLAGSNPSQVFANIPYHCKIDEFTHASRDRISSNDARFLYCGQLIHRKGIDLLCAAFSRLIESGASATLTLAGEGPLRTGIEKTLTPAVANRIRFLGFQQVEQLAKTFAESNVFVLPSRHDGWGVVVNQAIASGMPVIATTEVGAANDLVESDRNGFRIAADSEQALFDALKYFVDHPCDIRRFGEQSLEISRRIGLQQAVEDWYSFFCESLGEGVAEAGVRTAQQRLPEVSPP